MRQNNPLSNHQSWMGITGVTQAAAVGPEGWGRARHPSRSIDRHTSIARSFHEPTRTNCRCPSSTLQAAIWAPVSEARLGIRTRRAHRLWQAWDDGAVTAPTLRCCLDPHPITSHPRQTTNFRPPLRPAPIRRPPWSPSPRPQPPAQTAVGRRVSLTNRARHERAQAEATAETFFTSMARRPRMPPSIGHGQSNPFPRSPCGGGNLLFS